jgi:phage tail sheath protein FI
MATAYLSPGVYVEEVSGGVKPIAGVGTSTGAFVGIAEKGVIGKAVLVTNWTQFVNEFGGFIPDRYLAYAVYGFFAEGGTSCYVVRTCHYDNNKKVTAIASAGTLVDDDNAKCMRIYASSEGTWGDKITVKVEPASEGTGFKLKVSYPDESTEVEAFDKLMMSGVEDTVNNASKFITVEKDTWKEDGSDVTGSGKNPKKDQKVTLSGGNDGLSSLIDSDFYGDESAQNGLHAFDVIDDINIVAIPDKAGDPDVILGGLTYCKNRKDCFFIADSPYGSIPTDIVKFRKGTGGGYTGNAFNSSYGSLYYPWVYISDPLTGKKKAIPPSGAVAGTYAYTDSARGVHKAPAGISEGYLDSVVGVERIVTKGEHDVLNPANINVIRSLPSGICIWGARTLSADSEWLYVNVRRLLLYIEESIDEGTQWVVFEPNDPALWGKVKRNITAFLLRVWRDGALFGATPDEAFFVKVDEENNPPEVRDAGQLIIEVGVAPVKPAEFVIIRISQKTLAKS